MKLVDGVLMTLCAGVLAGMIVTTWLGGDQGIALVGVAVCAAGLWVIFGERR